jgi:hypothetical protein
MPDVVVALLFLIAHATGYLWILKVAKLPTDGVALWYLVLCVGVLLLSSDDRGTP